MQLEEEHVWRTENGPAHTTVTEGLEMTPQREIPTGTWEGWWARRWAARPWRVSVNVLGQARRQRGLLTTPGGRPPSLRLFHRLFVLAHDLWFYAALKGTRVQK